MGPVPAGLQLNVAYRLKGQPDLHTDFLTDIYLHKYLMQLPFPAGLKLISSLERNIRVRNLMKTCALELWHLLVSLNRGLPGNRRHGMWFTSDQESTKKPEDRFVRLIWLPWL